MGHSAGRHLTVLAQLAFLSSCQSQLNKVRKQVENLLAKMDMGSLTESREWDHSCVGATMPLSGVIRA